MDTENLPIHLKPGPFMQNMRREAAIDEESIRYAKRYIGLVDILGYRQLVHDLGPEAPKQLFGDLFLGFLLADSHSASLSTRLFSDTLIVSSVDSNPINFWNMVSMLSALTTHLLERGLLLRGGIVYGDHFETEGILVSPALIEAHQLESEVSVNPRILVSQEALRMGTKDLSEHDGTEGIVVDTYHRKVDKRLITHSSDSPELSFDPARVELRYLKYGEHPDLANIDHHINHCVKEGNGLLVRLRQGLNLANDRASDTRAKAKVAYAIGRWNHYLDNFAIQDMVPSRKTGPVER